MADPIVFFDIAGENQAQLADFYRACFEWEIAPTGALTIAGSSVVSGAIRQDPTEVRLYIGVPNVESSLNKVLQHGGQIEKDRFEVPGIAILGLFKDPAGNPMGLVELAVGSVDGSEVKVP